MASTTYLFSNTSKVSRRQLPDDTTGIAIPATITILDSKAKFRKAGDWTKTNQSWSGLRATVEDVKYSLTGSKYFNPTKIALTGLSISEAAKANIMYSADGKIFMNTAGNQVGSVVLSGAAFAAACDVKPDDHGIVQAFNWYKSKRVSHPDSTPVSITLPSSLVLTCYVGSFKADLKDAANNMFTFDATMYLVPQEN
jgi:hypothetical protein